MLGLKLSIFHARGELTMLATTSVSRLGFSSSNSRRRSLFSWRNRISSGVRAPSWKKRFFDDFPHHAIFELDLILGFTCSSAQYSNT